MVSDERARDESSRVPAKSAFRHRSGIRNVGVSNGLCTRLDPGEAGNGTLADNTLQRMADLAELALVELDWVGMARV